MTRPTNQELAEQFRHLLTHGAKDSLSEDTMIETKRWRNKLWKAFAEIEDRLCPLNVIDRERREHESE